MISATFCSIRLTFCMWTSNWYWLSNIDEFNLEFFSFTKMTKKLYQMSNICRYTKYVISMFFFHQRQNVIVLWTGKYFARTSSTCPSQLTKIVCPTLKSFFASFAYHSKVKSKPLYISSVKFNFLFSPSMILTTNILRSFQKLNWGNNSYLMA